MPPLAHRLRPQTLAEFVGQEHVVGANTPLRLAIEADQLTSVILSGPPGTGKTTLASVIAKTTNAAFVQLNAVTSGIKDLKEVCGEAERIRQALGQRTTLFVDEIHRFNTAQQDALLPFVEQGSVILIGATTENPYFSVNSALVSRSHVYLLRVLDEGELLTILRNALADERGFAGTVTMSDGALAHIARVAKGDARAALNSLELAVASAQRRNVPIETIVQELETARQRYDASAEDHYNRISAFIKTLRGSDVDAAMVWLFSMVEAGENVDFLFRRMAIFACEDVGLADPQALVQVQQCWQAFDRIGRPEGDYFLAQACVYLAQAPKSNAVTKAMAGAKQLVKNAPSLEVPLHLRNAPVKGMADQGYGQGYAYPHNDPEGVVTAAYFPQGMTPVELYEPVDRGFESQVRERLQKIRSKLRL